MTAFRDSRPPTDSPSSAEEALARLKSSNSELARQLAERDERIAELLAKIRELGDEIKLLKKLSRRRTTCPTGPFAAASSIEPSATCRSSPRRSSTSWKSGSFRAAAASWRRCRRGPRSAEACRPRQDPRRGMASQHGNSMLASAQFPGKLLLLRTNRATP